MYSSEQLLSDLTWILEAREVFVCDEPLAGFLDNDWRQRLAALNDDTDCLVEHMAAAKSHFLGTYFEQLFSFAVTYFTSLEVLAEHEQIHASGKTLGEVDLLVRDLAGRVLQLEIALKFYLERQDLYPNVWIGPNKNDSLTKKVSHARQHQLTILTKPEGKQWLAKFITNTDVKPNLMIYGRHFYSVPAQDAAFFADDAICSAWVRLSELPRLGPYLLDLHEAQKPNWMTPRNNLNLSKRINAEFMVELSQRFVDDDRPILFSCRKYADLSETNTFWLFVCPDDW
ncbi:DUF1853 family protein [Marinomonas fungiae]|uniref:DUF1853 family protein n=1 Tax=Marinomonas fungiae TaxID=1137284 RepID=A0A0K6IGN3_9GAMM|nr:DUF1853 family protein [Marinomonas fungiae]CUB02196.1 Uncharacterized protein Ga0061065_10126 [Marinomonas fungiae]